MTRAAFRVYQRENQPVIITGVTERWRAAEWVDSLGRPDVQSLRSLFGGDEVTVHDGGHDTREMTVAGYASSWSSPVTARLITTSTVRLGGCAVDGAGKLHWLEGRPQEKGRQAVVKYAPGAPGASTRGAIDVSPGDVNVRTRVHEYGGKSFVLEPDGSLIYSSFTTELGQPNVSFHGWHALVRASSLSTLLGRAANVHAEKAAGVQPVLPLETPRECAYPRPRRKQVALRGT